MELQADCLAGVWANLNNQVKTACSRAISRAGSTPQRRSATTRCRSAHRARWCRNPSPTAPRSSACAGSRRGSTAAARKPATRSARESFKGTCRQFGAGRNAECAQPLPIEPAPSSLPPVPVRLRPLMLELGRADLSSPLSRPQGSTFPRTLALTAYLFPLRSFQMQHPTLAPFGSSHERPAAIRICSPRQRGNRSRFRQKNCEHLR